MFLLILTLFRMPKLSGRVILKIRNSSAQPSFLMSRTMKIRKLKLFYFQKNARYRAKELWRDIFLGNLSLKEGKNSVGLPVLILEFWWRHVKTKNSILNKCTNPALQNEMDTGWLNYKINTLHKNVQVSFTCVDPLETVHLSSLQACKYKRGQSVEPTDTWLVYEGSDAFGSVRSFLGDVKLGRRGLDKGSWALRITRNTFLVGKLLTDRHRTM